MKLFSWVSSIVCLLCLMSCSDAQDQASGDVLRSDLSLVAVATDATFPPFEYLDNAGLIRGFDIELFSAIAADQNFKVVFYNVTFDKLFEHLENREATALIASLSITPERQKTMIFSDSYFSIKQLILVRETNTASSLADLAEQRIGVVSGTSSESFVVQSLGNRETIVHFDDVGKMEESFENNQLDAIVSDDQVIKAYAKQSQFPVRMISDSTSPVEESGIAMRKEAGSDVLMDKINTGLRNIKRNGTYDVIYRKYFE